MHTSGKDLNLTVNGITICYDDFGIGEIPIIFIHGFPFDKSSWQPQMEFLQSTNRVISYDIRGFGKSTIGKEKLTIKLFAEDLIKLMDALGIDKAIVCGLSMGGYILLNAVNYFPERFAAIILSDTQCIADSLETKVKRHKSIEQIKADGLNGFAEGFINNVFCKKSLATKIGWVEIIKKIILSSSPETVTSTLAALANRWEMCSSLNKIIVPTLILCGSEDMITPIAQSEFLQLHIANSQLKIIEEAGHLSNLEQPDSFNLNLANFISGLLKS